MYNKRNKIYFLRKTDIYLIKHIFKTNTYLIKHIYKNIYLKIGHI